MPAAIAGVSHQPGCIELKQTRPDEESGRSAQSSVSVTCARLAKAYLAIRGLDMGGVGRRGEREENDEYYCATDRRHVHEWL